MRKSYVLIGAASVSLAGCGGSGDDPANQAAANAAAAEKKPKPAYCFFKEPDTKDWSASRDKQGNIVVKGKAYRQDSRYKAVLQPAVVSGNSAEISPTIVQNDTGFGAPDNWWDMTATIPDSASVEQVTVTCGARALAELSVPAGK
ncbi:MAG TPA: hypothetical protein VM308_08040 [Sphingomicrobium sp.]|nr:hypothetical protein [Sphingomicrobium sp.]